jgi:hypothetical protein
MTYHEIQPNHFIAENGAIEIKGWLTKDTFPGDVSPVWKTKVRTLAGETIIEGISPEIILLRLAHDVTRL